VEAVGWWKICLTLGRKNRPGYASWKLLDSHSSVVDYFLNLVGCEVHFYQRRRDRCFR